MQATPSKENPPCGGPACFAVTPPIRAVDAPNVVAAFEAPAVVAGLDDVAMEGQAVERRGRHLGVAAGGTVLALATIPPAPAADALTGAAKKPEAILGLIADHRAAIAATDDAMRHYDEMEQTIPDDRRKGDFFGGKVDEVATDDPRWTAACHRFNASFRKGLPYCNCLQAQSRKSLRRPNLRLGMRPPTSE